MPKKRYGWMTPAVPEISRFNDVEYEVRLTEKEKSEKQSALRNDLIARLEDLRRSVKVTSTDEKSSTANSYQTEKVHFSGDSVIFEVGTRSRSSELDGTHSRQVTRTSIGELSRMQALLEGFKHHVTFVDNIAGKSYSRSFSHYRHFTSLPLSISNSLSVLTDGNRDFRSVLNDVNHKPLFPDLHHCIEAINKLITESARKRKASSRKFLFQSQKTQAEIGQALIDLCTAMRSIVGSEGPSSDLEQGTKGDKQNTFDFPSVSRNGESEALKEAIRRREETCSRAVSFLTKFFEEYIEYSSSLPLAGRAYLSLGRFRQFTRSMALEVNSEAILSLSSLNDKVMEGDKSSIDGTKLVKRISRLTDYLNCYIQYARNFSKGGVEAQEDGDGDEDGAVEDSTDGEGDIGVCEEREAEVAEGPPPKKVKI